MYLIWSISVYFSVLMNAVECNVTNMFSIENKKTIASLETTRKPVVVSTVSECAVVCWTAFDCLYGVFNPVTGNCILSDAVYNTKFEDSNSNMVLRKCGRKVRKGIYKNMMVFNRT